MGMLVNPFGVVSGVNTPEYSYRTTVTDVTTVAAGVARSFAGVDIGTAHTDRQVIVIWSGRTSVKATGTPTVTVGGVSATQVVGLAGNAGAQICMFRANVPTGTTATIDVTINQQSTDGVIHVYRVVPRTVVGMSVDSGSAESLATTTVTATDIAVVTGGFLICGCIDGLNPTLTRVYNGVDTPTVDYASTAINARTRLAWSVTSTETVGTNDPGASKPATNGFNLNIVAASWD